MPSNKKPTTTLNLKRHFTDSKQDGYELLKWQKCDAQIRNYQTNEVIFSQADLEFPVGWSQNAINIVAQKYFSGDLNSKHREYSLKQLINRVVYTIAEHGQKEGYFSSDTEAQIFVEELKYVLASQRAAFNSPVWFNIGVSNRSQQASACFILNVEDSMPDILEWYKEEGLIFKGGSGSGVNLSKLRSSLEGLSKSAGKASGPVSFMRGADASAGSIQSGGKTRRAAKMVILNVDHPDVEEFIWCKAKEEQKAHALAKAGFDVGIDGRDLYNIQYQNANNSVRVSNAFMKAVAEDQDWDLKAINSQNKVLKTVKARDLFRQICQAAWECADPGLQFDDTINDWHTTPNAGRINASNPCSEYMHLDNSACNLASLNLLKFLDKDGKFKIADFLHTIELIILAQEILVGYSEYPTAKITKTAKAYRQLGIGYANLGALLMSQGLAYDSDIGRAQAAVITAIMTGQSYRVSAQVAQKLGAFSGYKKDAKNVIRVLQKHRQQVEDIDVKLVSEEFLTTAATVWDEAIHLAQVHGVRNSQVSVLAPTGTIGLMMDCDTTGIEPDLGLVKFKSLVGGGHMTFVNQSVNKALVKLGYAADQIKAIEDYISQYSSLVEAPHLKPEHLPIFACAIGDNVISALGHIKMMASVQPFLSGAISKTVNMPEETTVEDVQNIYIEAWRRGVKAIAIYRDNCKATQPVTVSQKTEDGEEADGEETSFGAEKFVFRGAIRKELPAMRQSKTFKFRIANTKGFMTVGEFEDGQPGEIFITVAKQGSTLAGFTDALAISVSHGLQYGVPLKSYVKSFINMSFAPNGVTDDSDIRIATSFVDYIFKKLARTYLSYDDLVELGIINFSEQTKKADEIQTSLLNTKAQDQATNQIQKISTPAQPDVNQDQNPNNKLQDDLSTPLCLSCGHQTQKSGACYVCPVCGLSTGCG
ncbi:MAG: vitamin B12-dependent ribonucleotide reductase [Candidatus Saccharibacteria bacterium]|nr:vitamin B12-dependent ribonucleotide reductase [Candidatus Saccharibacteria bacterium]